MGIILSRFRKKKTTIEVLEELETQIKEIEQYGQNTEQKHKKIVGTLILYSVILYIVTAFVFYFYFFPASLYDQIFYIIPLLIFPILILLTKKMVSWYYKRKISHNQDKLSTMQTEKKKILDEVTETETYKKAKEILLKFAPDQLRMTPLSPQPTFKVSTAVETPRRPATPQAVISPLPSSGELRRRAVTNQNQQVQLQSAIPPSIGAMPIGAAPTQQQQPSTPFQAGIRPVNPSSIGFRSPLPRPVLPRQRTYFDRLVDYLVGDGPSNRYALICRNCESHNGMALKEEFEYFGFRCCYCNFWNPARKQKPSAPKLEYDSSILHTSSTENTPEHTSPTTANVEPIKLASMETSSPSDTDSDIEVVERPASEEVEHVEEPNSNDCEKADGKCEDKPLKESEETDEKMDVDGSFS